MPSERVTVTGPRGQELAAILDLPDGQPTAHALFAHCFTCSKDFRASARVSRALTRRGIAVLRCDFTGLGESGGDFSETTFSSSVDDLVAWAAWLAEHRSPPTLLVGHSLGGAAVLAAVERVGGVAAVATIGAPADPEHVTHLFSDPTGRVPAELATEGESCVTIGDRQFLVRRELLEDLAGQRQAERVAGLGAALLVLHAPGDEVVGVDNARRLFDTARHPKSFVALDGADHLLTRRADAEYVADVVATWASRYLPVADEGHPDRDVAPPGTPGGAVAPAVAPGVVVVRETGEGPFTQVVRAGRHVWRADEPTPADGGPTGGTDTGPTPYDLLLAGLGSCTAMTLRMYADRKDWPLERVTVTLRQEQVHAEDSSRCVDGGTDCVRQFVREVHLAGPLDEGQRARLLEMADRCPVHRTLEAGVRVVTRAANG